MVTANPGEDEELNSLTSESNCMSSSDLFIGFVWAANGNELIIHPKVSAQKMKRKIFLIVAVIFCSYIKSGQTWCAIVSHNHVRVEIREINLTDLTLYPLLKKNIIH